MLTSNSFFGSEPQSQCTLMPGLDADEAQTQHCRVEQCCSVGCLSKVPGWFQDENADASDERVQHVLEASVAVTAVSGRCVDLSEHRRLSRSMTRMETV